MTPPLSKLDGIVLIMCSGIISWLLANVGIDTGNMEMAAIANYFFPPLISLFTCVVFLLIDWKLSKRRVTTTIILVTLNVCAGILIRVASFS